MEEGAAFKCLVYVVEVLLQETEPAPVRLIVSEGDQVTLPPPPAPSLPMATTAIKSNPSRRCANCGPDASQVVLRKCIVLSSSPTLDPKPKAYPSTLHKEITTANACVSRRPSTCEPSMRRLGGGSGGGGMSY